MLIRRVGENVTLRREALRHLGCMYLVHRAVCHQGKTSVACAVQGSSEIFFTTKEKAGGTQGNRVMVPGLPAHR